MRGVVWWLYVVVFKVRSESKRSPGTDFAAEDMEYNIRAIFVYLAAHFQNKYT